MTKEVAPHLKFFKACQSGDIKTVVDLISEVRINRRDSEGWIALMMAARCGRDNVVEILIKNNAKLDLYLPKNAMTALMLASRYNEALIVEKLIQAGANLNHQNKDGDTALILAVQFNHKNIVDQLIKAKANLNINVDDGITALMISSWPKNIDSFDNLLKNGVIVDQKSLRTLLRYGTARRGGLASALII